MPKEAKNFGRGQLSGTFQSKQKPIPFSSFGLYQISVVKSIVINPNRVIGLFSFNHQDTKDMNLKLKNYQHCLPFSGQDDV
jgi:hypothetical protein